MKHQNLFILLCFFTFFGSPKDVDIYSNNWNDQLSLSTIRYQKGLELLRLLNEKLLELDYHFSTFLNEYPERLDPSISAILYFNQTDFQQLSDSEKTRQLCYLNFSFQWEAALNTIWIENEYLRGANELLQDELGELFTHYTRFLAYSATLEECRQTDSWELLDQKLEQYVKQCRADRAAGRTDEANRAHINLEFAVDRMLSFLDQYSQTIRQGSLYYYKFEKMLIPLATTGACLEPPPDSFTDLLLQIRESSLQFQQTYDLTELEGSRLKDLLYGY